MCYRNMFGRYSVCPEGVRYKFGIVRNSSVRMRKYPVDVRRTFGEQSGRNSFHPVANGESLERNGDIRRMFGMYTADIRKIY